MAKRTRAAALLLAGLFALAGGLLVPVAWAQEAPPSPEAVEIARTLKCPVCENQSVADSPAQLAQEMRAYIQRRLGAGDQRATIVADLVDRYGEGILLEPPRSGFTLLVWWLPALSLALGAAVVALTLRRWTRPSAAPDPAPAARHAGARSESGHNGTAGPAGMPAGPEDLSPEEIERYRARVADELARRERGLV
jgi:cytochrome c-type biogenesis protein CcmH